MSGIQLPDYSLHISIYKVMIDSTEGEEKLYWQERYEELLQVIEIEETRKAVKKLANKIQSWN